MSKNNLELFIQLGLEYLVVVAKIMNSCSKSVIRCKQRSVTLIQHKLTLEIPHQSMHIFFFARTEAMLAAECELIYSYLRVTLYPAPLEVESSYSL